VAQTQNVKSQSHRAARPAAAAGRGGRRWLALAGVLVLAGALAVVLTLKASRGEARPIATLETADFHSLAFSPDEADVAFFGHHNGVMRSDDGGRTWRPLVAQPGFDAMGMAIGRGSGPRRGTSIYLTGHNAFLTSTDGGASWQPVAHDLPGTDIHGFAMSPDDPKRLYAFVVGHGIFRSADGGRTWRRLEGEAPRDVTALAAGAGEPETLYVGTARSGVVKTADGGRSFTRVASGLGSGPVLALAVDPAARQTLYAGLEGGLYKTTDGGAAWSRLPFPGDNAVALAVSRVRPNVLLAITVKNRQGQVFRSENGGATWGPRT
jgi:photosystem II stability/assembly factor-like uncharacterized protein